jgi:hypothetical protein
MSLHNSHTHNKTLKDTIEEQLEEMEGDGSIKLVNPFSISFIICNIPAKYGAATLSKQNWLASIMG